MWSGLRRSDWRRRHSGQAANSEDAGGVGVVPHPLQTHSPSSGSTTPSAQMAPPAGSAWCLTTRKPLFLRPEAPRPQPKCLRRRDRCGASHPANPFSFVRKHHALSSTGAAGGVDVVPHPPQTLIPSSGDTTPSAQMTPPARPAWCLIPRKPLFLRPEAPRPQPKQLLSRSRRAEPLQLPPPPRTGQVPAAGLPQTQPTQFVEMK